MKEDLRELMFNCYNPSYLVRSDTSSYACSVSFWLKASATLFFATFKGAGMLLSYHNSSFVYI